MNREIKFRAWDTTYSTMIDWDCLTRKEAGWGNFLDEIFRKEFNGRLLLMQFTGLHDKDGVEIFEGDIVEVLHRTEHQEDWYRTKGVVEYSPAEFYIRGDGHSITCHFHYNDSDREVLGNIYENPELIESKTFSFN